MTSEATPIKQTLSTCLFELTQIDHERRVLKKGGTVHSSTIDSLHKKCEDVHTKLQSIVKTTQASKDLSLVADFSLVLADFSEQYKKVEKLRGRHFSPSFSSQTWSTPPLSPILSPQPSKEERKKEPSHIASMRKVQSTIESNRFGDIQLQILRLEAAHANYANQIFEQFYILENPGSTSPRSQKVSLGRMAFLTQKSSTNDTRFEAVQKVLSKAISELGSSRGTQFDSSLDVDSEDDQPPGRKDDDLFDLDLDLTDFPLSSPKPSLAPQSKKTSSSSSSSTTSSFGTTLPRQSLVIQPRFPINPSTREDRQAVWKGVWDDTLAILNNGGYTNSKGQFVSIDTAPSVKGTLAYCGPTDTQRTPPAEKQRKQEIFVIDRDCLKIAGYYSRRGCRVAILNMASDTHPGGGVDFPTPTQAQEEEVAKRTGLIHAIAPVARKGKQKNDFYPLSTKLGELSALYSPRVPVFRNGAEDGYSVMDESFEVDIMSVAAYKRAQQPSDGRLTKQEAKGIFAKMRTMLQMAKEHGADVVVLGAFGCGAYNNPPAHIAELFDLALRKFPNSFDVVFFTIIDDRNARSKDGNFLPFAQYFIQRGAKVSDGFKKLAPRDLVPTTTDDDKHAGGSQGQRKERIEAVKKLAQTGVVSFSNLKSNKDTFFLSTFYRCSFKMGPWVFKCAEAAYQAGRDPKKVKEFVKLDAFAAFTHGQDVPATEVGGSGWHNRSVLHMKTVLKAKFDQNPELKELLLATSDAYLAMHTDKDDFWRDGGDIGKGNKLGELLMELRGQYGGTGVVPAPTT